MHVKLAYVGFLCGMIVDRSGWGLSWVRAYLWDKEFLRVGGLGGGSGQNPEVFEESSNF